MPLLELLQLARRGHQVRAFVREMVAPVGDNGLQRAFSGSGDCLDHNARLGSPAQSVAIDLLVLEKVIETADPVLVYCADDFVLDVVDAIFTMQRLVYLAARATFSQEIKVFCDLFDVYMRENSSSGV